MVHIPIPILARVTSEEFTARDSSMGSSGGTTEVMMRTHSRRSLYLLRSGFSVPVWCGRWGRGWGRGEQDKRHKLEQMNIHMQTVHCLQCSSNQLYNHQHKLKIAEIVVSFLD